MTAVVGVLEGALKLSSDLKGSDPQQGNLQGHIVTHWSFYVFVPLTVVATVAIVVAGIFQMWPLLIGSCLFAITNIVGMINAYELSVNPAIEEGVKQLAAKVSTLTEENNSLKHIDDDVKESIKDLGTLDKEYQEAVKKGDSKLASMIQALAVTNKKLKESLKRAEKLEGIVNDLTKEIDSFTKESVKFAQENELLKNQNDSLANATKTLETDDVALGKDVTDLSKTKDDLEKLTQKHTDQIKLLKEIDALKVKAISDTKTELLKLIEENKQLQITISTADKATNNVGKVGDKLEKVDQDLDKKLKKLDDYETLLKLLKEQHKDVFEKWKEYLKTK